MSEPVKLSNQQIDEAIVKNYRLSGILTTDEAKSSYFWHGEDMHRADIAELMTDKIEAAQSRIAARLHHQLVEERRVHKEKLVTWVQSLEEKGTTEKFLKTYLDNLIVTHDHGKPYEAAVLYLKQFFWSIKQRIKGVDEVLYPICPVFWSEGGAGKTHNIERLLSPIRQYVYAVKVDQVVGDNFSGVMLAKKLCVFFDELQGAAGRQEGPIKAIMTAKTLEGRHMRQSEAYQRPNRLAFIGASNYAPPHNFVDLNIARRMGSIEIRSKFDSKEEEERCIAIRDSISVDDIWRCVSCDEPNPMQHADKELLKWIKERHRELIEDQDIFAQFGRRRLVYARGAKTPAHELRPELSKFAASEELKRPRLSNEVMYEGFNRAGFRMTKPNRRYFMPDHMIQHYEDPD